MRLIVFFVIAFLFSFVVKSFSASSMLFRSGGAFFSGSGIPLAPCMPGSFYTDINTGDFYSCKQDKTWFKQTGGTISDSMLERKTPQSLSSTSQINCLPSVRLVPGKPQEVIVPIDSAEVSDVTLTSNPAILTTGHVAGDICILEGAGDRGFSSVTLGPSNSLSMASDCSIDRRAHAIFLWSGSEWVFIGGSCSTVDVGEGTRNPYWGIDTDGFFYKIVATPDGIELKDFSENYVNLSARSFSLIGSGTNGGFMELAGGDQSNEPSWFALRRGGLAPYKWVTLHPDENGQIRVFRDEDGALSTPTDSDGNIIPTLVTHPTDCTTITTGRQNDLCWELDSNDLFKCETSDGVCDTTSEWKKIRGIIDTCEMIIESPAGIDEFEFCEKTQPRIITKVSCECYGACTTPPQISICSGEDLGDDTCTTPVVVNLSCTATGASSTSLSNPSLGASGTVSVLITNAPSADSKMLRVMVEYAIQ